MREKPNIRPGKSALAILSALVFSAAVFAGMARAQEVSKSLAGFASDPDAPINIEADRFEIFDNKKIAIFLGNVKATQGEFVLLTPHLEVIYEGNAGEGATGSSQIKRLRAKQKVHITSKDQKSTSDWADFDVIKQIVVIGGNVVLTQGDHVMRGDRVVINLKTGTSHIDGDKSKGRVRVLFKPAGKGEAGKAKAARSSKPAARSTGVKGSAPGSSGKIGTGWTSRTTPE